MEHKLYQLKKFDFFFTIKHFFSLSTILAWGFIFFLGLANKVKAQQAIITSAGTTTWTNANVIIDPTLNFGNATVDLHGVTAQITVGYILGQDILVYPNTVAGITSVFDATTGTLTLNGDATVAQYQVALRSIQYQNVAAIPTNGNRVITFTLIDNLMLDPCGFGLDHIYRYIPNGGSITWNAADVAATAHTYFGLQGYLATSTCAAENLVLFNGAAQGMPGNIGWIGLSDDPPLTGSLEGEFFWVRGPEGLAGMQAWTGGTGGNAFMGNYENFGAIEPNGGVGEESVAMGWHATGEWVDAAGTNPLIVGYYLEFGGMPGDPVLQLADTKTVNVASPLPITLLNFDAKRFGGEVELDWTTATEKNNKGFEIETSIDANHFKKIIFVEGSGNSNEINHYQSIVQNFESAYYRLKQIDFDGGFSYSPICFVDGFTSEEELILYPNPTSGEFYIKNIVDTKHLVINIFSLKGDKLTTIQGEKAKIESVISKKIKKMSDGIYMFAIQINEKSYYKRVKVIKK